MIKKALTGISLLLLLLVTGCMKQNLLAEEESALARYGGAMQPTAEEQENSMVVVDCAEQQGKIMEIEKFNGSSTTSPLPGEASRKWLQGLRTKTTRVWIQLVFVYNNGNINYNYMYSGSNLPVEDALAFYSTTSDSLLIALSGHKNSGSKLMPEGEAYKDFVRETILHYKRKFPKIKYIQVSNEPDAGKETMDTYYPVYQNYYRGLHEANEILKLENLLTGHIYDPVLMSNGAFTSNVPNMLNYAHAFFTAYAADTDPQKKLDYFSFHSYGESNRPLELLTARHRIDSAMQSHGLPIIPVFLSEYGMVGGSGLPGGLTLEQTVTMQPAGQLSKAFYLYQGGIDRVLNWTIHHSSIKYKSQLLDLENAIASPYGNALLLAQKLSDRKKRVKAESKGIDDAGLGIHVLAAEGNNKGIAVLVWNYNWRTAVADQTIDVLIKNIPEQHFDKQKIHSTMYVIDSKNNNYFINPSQTSLTVKSEHTFDYQSYLKIPVLLERSSVVLILLTPEKE